MECSVERRDFCSTFRLLIKLGTDAKVNKERKMSSTQRQLSDELEQWKCHMMDQIWIELNACLNCNTIEDEETRLQLLRADVESVLNDVMNFVFKPSLKCHSNNCPCDMLDGNHFCHYNINVNCKACHDLSRTHENDHSELYLEEFMRITCLGMFEHEYDKFNCFHVGSCPNKLSFSAVCKDCVANDILSTSFHNMSTQHKTIKLQQEAVSQVHRLMERLDACEQLFPTTKHLAIAFPLYGTLDFIVKVQCLNLWLNITCSLCHKLKVFGSMIRTDERNIDWPVMELDDPFPCHNDVDVISEPSADFEDKNDADSGTPQQLHLCVGVVPHNEPTYCVPESFCNNCHLARRVDFSNQDKLLHSLKKIKTFPSNTTGAVSLDVPFNDCSTDEHDGKSAIFRPYVDNCLKKMGMQRLVKRLKELSHLSLQRAREVLESSSSVDMKPLNDAGGLESATTGTLQSESCSSLQHSSERNGNMVECFDWCKGFQSMGLPSFHCTYLFLAQVPLHIIHDCLRLRLEQRPQGVPSYLSVRQLIRECKEVLHAATDMKQYYQDMVCPVIYDSQNKHDKLTFGLRLFDEDLSRMLEAYFSFLQSWIDMYQSCSESSHCFVFILEEEWRFAKGTCLYIVNGTAEAGKRFSSIAFNLLNCTVDFINCGVKEITEQIDKSFRPCGCNIDQEIEYGEEGICHESDLSQDNKNRRCLNQKQVLQVSFRRVKHLFHQARERVMKSLCFAKRLMKDLEIAATFKINVSPAVLLKKLLDTDHVHVQAKVNPGYMMFMTGGAAKGQPLLQLLAVLCGHDNESVAAMEQVVEEIDGHHSVSGGGHLLLVNSDVGEDGVSAWPPWTGQTVVMESSLETEFALSHVKVDGLLYVSSQSSLLTEKVGEFSRLMTGTLELVHERASCHSSVTESLINLKANALHLQEKLAEVVRQVYSSLTCDELLQHEEHLRKLHMETMLQCYYFCFEYSKEVMRIVSQYQRQRQCRTLVRSAVDWMTFVKEKCEQGKGTRPRWANQGLDFLASVCDPKFLVHLSNEEFETFKQTISSTLTHVIGTMEQRPILPGMCDVNNSVTPRQPYQRFFSWQGQSRRTGYNRTLSVHTAEKDHPDVTSLSPDSGRSSSSQHSIGSELAESHGLTGSSGLSSQTSVNQSDGIPTSPLVDRPFSRRRTICRKIMEMEGDRDRSMRFRGRIGLVADKVREPGHTINVRRVNFRWQRGIKIGEGQFGKVYTAVNVNTGELMAVKEMKLRPNDVQQLRGMCDEIRMFEGLQHPNLVKYYGVEVHSDRVMMFMEYCDTGTVEDAAKMGLPEYLMRRYTGELILAVAYLHENSIVHRDIKGANVFLTSDGHVKLGDFGCSVKLKNAVTMPGEFSSLVGTTAYMAPEVITQNDQSGYGRAADIWSLGCVLIEMATGKRPWPDMDNNYQIMFKVGMGQRPAIPDSLSPEGREFLDLVLCNNPDQRPSAHQLLDHTFTKVYSDADEEDVNNETYRRYQHGITIG